MLSSTGRRGKCPKQKQFWITVLKKGPCIKNWKHCKEMNAKIWIYLSWTHPKYWATVKNYWPIDNNNVFWLMSYQTQLLGLWPSLQPAATAAVHAVCCGPNAQDLDWDNFIYPKREISFTVNRPHKNKAPPVAWTWQWQQITNGQQPHRLLHEPNIHSI